MMKRLFSLLLAGCLLLGLTACGKNEASVPMPAVDRPALCARLAVFRLEDGGFQWPPDSWPESIEITCYACEYFRLSGQTNRCDAAPALPAGSRPEDRVRKMDAVDLFLWGIPMQAAIRDTAQLNAVLIAKQTFFRQDRIQDLVPGLED